MHMKSGEKSVSRDKYFVLFSWYGMVWYGILEFNIPLDTV